MDLSTLWSQFGSAVTSFLPLDPLRSFIDTFEPTYLGAINWFFPVGTCLNIFAAWLACYGLFVLYHIILRWLRVIE